LAGCYAWWQGRGPYTLDRAVLQRGVTDGKVPTEGVLHHTGWTSMPSKGGSTEAAQRRGVREDKCVLWRRVGPRPGVPMRPRGAHVCCLFASSVQQSRIWGLMEAPLQECPVGCDGARGSPRRMSPSRYGREGGRVMGRVTGRIQARVTIQLAVTAGRAVGFGRCWGTSPMVGMRSTCRQTTLRVAGDDNLSFPPSSPHRHHAHKLRRHVTATPREGGGGSPRISPQTPSGSPSLCPAAYSCSRHSPSLRS
jgi:hypothetical protein